MRLLSCILDHRQTASQHSCQHHIDGSANGHLVHINRSADQLVRPGANHTLNGIHLGTQQFKALNMQVNGPHTEVAAAGHSHLRLLKPTQHSTNQVITGAKTGGQLIGHALAF